MATTQSSKSTIEYTASAGAIRAYGIPVDLPFGTHPRSEPLQVRGEDGHDWEVWSEDGFFVHAQRPRTDAEEEQYIDSLNARVFSGFFSKDRQGMCAAIADHIQDLAESRVCPRDKRKARKTVQKIAELAYLQTELLHLPRVDMSAMRRRLASLGVNLEQQDLMGALEAEVHHG